MAWQPNAAQLGQLAKVLRDSLSGHNVAAQRQAESMIEQAKKSPDINNYLTYLTTHSNAEVELTPENYQAARSAAAILLKNNVRTLWPSIPDESKTYIRGTISLGLQDTNVIIRNYTGNVITELVKKGGILSWPQVLPDLVAAVESPSSSPEVQDGAMGAIFKICEDNSQTLDKEYQSQRPLAFLIPKLLDFTSSTNPKIRARALNTLTIFLGDPIAITARENINTILPRLIQLTADPDDEVKRHVCRAFALMADGFPRVLLPHIHGIVEYTLVQQRNQQNADLALDAAEFFFEASSKATLRDSLGPFLAQIVPVLLDCMVYSEDDQSRLEGDEDDAEEEDAEQDIKPQFATSKRSHLESATNGDSAPNGYAYEDDDLDEGEIEEDDEYEGDPEDEWNLRKCSAAALDSLALHFGHPVFNATLPWLTENIQHKDWPNREAAVLALGAIGPGTIDVVKDHLPQLVPYIITQLNDEQPVVRQISCWTLSRFATWASKLDGSGRTTFFEPMMDGILKRMLDKNKKVQESAASAFATVEEAAAEELTPYCAIIVRQFVDCFNRYKDRNIFILYDCVQTLAEHAGPALAEPELVQLLMPALIARWQKIQDASREMFPLLECLSFVVTALGPTFSTFAKPFFDRCIRIIHQNLDESITASQDPLLDSPDKDFLVTSLDLLSAIIQALPEAESSALVTSSPLNMFELMAYCMKDDNNDVKQSAYALLGDCAIYIFARLRQFLPTLLQILIGQLDLSQVDEDPETGYRVINNACWSCGEIAMRAGEDAIAPFVDRLLEKLAMIIFTESAPASLTENAAIAIGRLGLACPRQLSPHLANFAVPFLGNMKNIGWTDEKGHAYKGFTDVVLANPPAMEKCLLDYFAEISSAPPVFLTGMGDAGPMTGFGSVLQTYSTMIGGGFDQFLHNLRPEQEQALRAMYGIGTQAA